MTKWILALVTVAAGCSAPLAADGAENTAPVAGVSLSKVADESGDKAAPRATIKTSPKRYLEGSINNAKRRMTKGKYTGDGWTWHARFPMDGFISSYLATRDTAWLDAAVTYFDWTISLLLTSPDGKRGWIGPAYRMKDRLGEHPIGDAIMIDPMVRFAALVLKGEPALAKKYGKSAKAYVALADELMFKKWQSRGTWREDGDYGAFTVWPWTYTEEEADRWREPPAGTQVGTMPFNMQVHWGLVAARLYRITGDEAWRTKAAKIFNFLKSRLVLYDGHYSWNYWEPFGPCDVAPDKPHAFSHWINTHPYRDYQAGEVRAIVEAFHHGITFDAQDMKRFVRTNVHVMWTGNLDDIKWNNSNAGVQKGALGTIRLASKPKGIFNRYAGTLWTGMSQFDATARSIYEKQLKPGTHQHAYYYNVTRQRKPSYERHHGEMPATVLDFPFNPNCTLTMVAVMPSVVARGKSTLVACKARVAGDLKIELRSKDGKRTVATLHEQSALKLGGIFNLTWTAKDVAPGRYRVRWTLKGEYRESPIEVR
jgi:hypothetical protein